MPEGNGKCLRARDLSAGVMPRILIETEFNASAESIRKVLIGLRTRMRAAGFDTAFVSRVELVLAEALNNIGEHAYADRAGGAVRMRAVFRDPELRVTLTDTGIAMPNGAPPSGCLPESTGPCETLPEGGFGWFLIRSQTESLDYRRADGINHLELCFRPRQGG